MRAPAACGHMLRHGVTVVLIYAPPLVAKRPTVGRCLAVGDLLQRSPHTQLEGRTYEIEGDVEGAPLACEVLVELRGRVRECNRRVRSGP